MKRIFVYLIFSLLLIACDKGERSAERLTVTLDITLATYSRVDIDQNRYVWEGNESLGLYISSTTPTNNCKADVAVADGVGYCTPSVDSYAAGDILYGYMPYSDGSSTCDKVKMAIPEQQSVEGAGNFSGEAMPMVADPYTLGQGGAVSLLFHPLGGFLCYNIYSSAQYADEQVVSVRYATSTPLAGEFTFDISSDNRTLPTLNNYSVTTTLANPYALTSSENAATPIYMVVAPGTYSGTLTVTTDKALYTYTLSRAVDRNHYYNINIDLSKAEYRKSLTASESVTATLTYQECKDVIDGYKSPKTYTNSYGSWIICAYDYGSAIQINDGKVSYIGTPTFSGAMSAIELSFCENYSDDIYLCTAAGSTSAVSIVKTIKVSGKSVKADISDLGLTSLYIRSGACARISTITITYGEQSGSVLPDPEPDPTPNPDPTPEPDPDPTPSTARYVWAELPVMEDSDNNGIHDSNSSIYYAHHLCAGSEQNAQRNGSARNYSVCYSAEHHCPLWVAAPRHAMYEVKKTDRTNAYGKDPKIPSDIQYNSTSTGGNCNKGHMLGSAERLSSAATNRQVFYYTNIAPQYSSTFNTGGGAWNNLEDHIDGLVCSDTLYVVVGCYFDSFSRNGASATPKKISFGGRSDVSCPTMFYYALLRTKNGNSGKRVQECSASELQCAAFTICHTMEKGHKPEAADMMSISELERLTGFKYFQNVPNAPKGSFSSSDWL